TATDSITGCVFSTEITILVFDITDCVDLDITMVTDGYVCDEGSTTLSVTGAGITGDDIYWYDAQFGGNRVGTGTTFDTPFITETTSYWASEVLIEGQMYTGQGIEIPTGTLSSTTNGGFTFNLT